MRAVIQYNIDTKQPLTFFPSIRDAARYVGVTDSAISKAINHILSNVRGWGWRYATDKEKEEFAISCKKVYNNHRDIVSYFVIGGASNHEDGQSAL